MFRGGKCLSSSVVCFGNRGGRSWVVFRELFNFPAAEGLHPTSSRCLVTCQPQGSNVKVNTRSSF